MDKKYKPYIVVTFSHGEDESKKINQLYNEGYILQAAVPVGSVTFLAFLSNGEAIQVQCNQVKYIFHKPIE
jgi:hypothetical protein